MRRALVVEDSHGQREILSRILSESGWLVVEAENGRQAMERILQYDDIELVLLDLYMPVMDGLEFLSELRGRVEFADTPRVLMMSVERAMSAISEVLAAGADEYIAKPFSMEILNRKLAAMGF